MTEQTTSFIQRYTFADFFDRLFRMLRYTWKTSLFGGLTLLAVPSLLIALLIPPALAGLSEMAVEAQSFDDAQAVRALWAMAGWNGVLVLVAVATGILTKLASLAVAHRTRDAATGRESRWTECIAEAFTSSLWRTIVQTFLKGLMLTAVIVVPTVIVVIAATLGGGGAAPLAIGMTLVYIGVTIASLWIIFSLLFSDYAVVFDGARTISGLRKSSQLVRGNWWRVFGISLLLTIALSFATGLITTPIVSASFLPSIGRMLEAGMEGSLTDEAVVRLFSNSAGLGVGIAISTMIQQLAVLLFMPVFYSLFYIDLKVRAGELGTSVEDQAYEGQADGEQQVTDRADTPPEHERE